MNGSFASFLRSSPFSQTISGVALTFVCGQVEAECQDANSRVNVALNKIRRQLGSGSITKLVVTLNDCTGSLLSLDKILHKYDVTLTGVRQDYLHDECYPHCHTDASFTTKKSVEREVVETECGNIVKFLRENLDCWRSVNSICFVCCHYVNIPDDVQFLLETDPSSKIIQKLDSTGAGPVFDLTEHPSFHNYTPWKYTIGKIVGK